MNLMMVILIYMAVVGAVLYVLTMTFQKSGFSLRQRIGLKRGISGLDFRNHPIRAALKVFLGVILFLFYWSGLGAGGMMGEMVPIVDPISAFFIACGLTDIFIYGSKILSAIGFLASYLGFYYFEMGATRAFKTTLTTLIVLVFAMFVISARKKGT